MNLAPTALHRARDRRRWLLTAVAVLVTMAMLAVPASAVSPQAVAAAVPQVCSAAPSTSVQLRDVSADSTHGAAVSCMARYGIVGGHADGTFRPQNLLSRGQMASLLARFIETGQGSPAARPEGVPFRDVAGSVHEANIAAVYGMGIAAGRTAEEFRPQGALTRAQMATFLHRTLDALGVELRVGRVSFRDVPRGSVHEPAISELAAAGIVQGTSEDEFAPERTLTREQASTLLLRSAAAMETQDTWAPSNRGRGKGSGNDPGRPGNGNPGNGGGDQPGDDQDQSTPPGDDAPGEDPVEDHDPVTDPVDDHDHGTDPVDDHDHGTDPVDDHDHGTDPVDDHDNGTDPVDDHDNGTDPVDDHDHGTDPVDDHDHGTDPVDDHDHGTDPVDDHDHGTTPPDSTDGGDPDPLAGDVISGNVSLPDLTVAAGETVTFDPNVTTTLEVSGNVVVEGTLRMRPANAGVTHTLRFVDVDESAYVGGHTTAPLTSDVGLWVVGDGKLDAVGTQREGWNRTGSSSTWLPSDVLKVAPVARGAWEFSDFKLGSTVPSVTAPDGTVHRAEVLNLTRNVRIQGTGDGSANPNRNGRAHAMFIGDQPQILRNVEFRHMGPREPSGGFTRGVDGRYPVHFHLKRDGARGSLLENVVVRDSGNRAFVIHGSNGVTLRNTVAFDVFDTAYWWDRDGNWPDETYPRNASHDVTYDRAVAANVMTDPFFRGFENGGFELGQGEGNACLECVAIAVWGSSTAAGFQWTEHANDKPNVWKFVDGVTHNNDVAGIRTWQNDPKVHVVEGVTSYHNGASGIDHGAYVNNYHYRDIVTFGHEWGLVSHAQTHEQGGTPIRWENIDVEADEAAFVIMNHVGSTTIPNRITGGTWQAPTAIGVYEDAGQEAGLYDFVGVSYNGRDIEPGDIDRVEMHPQSVIRIQRQDGSAYRVTASNVTAIPPFA
jgi:hypothetical protein